MCQAPALRKRKQKALRLRGRRVRSQNVMLKNRGCVRWAVRNHVRKDDDRQAEPQDKCGGRGGPDRRCISSTEQGAAPDLGGWFRPVQKRAHRGLPT